MTIEKITELLAVPKTTSGNDNSDWDALPAGLGKRLPNVYKEFVSIYGTGSIGGFLWVLNPFYPNPS